MKQSLGPLEQPTVASPTLPEELDDVTDMQLINLMVAFTRWADYSQTRLAAAEIDESAAEEALAVARSLNLIRFMPSAEALRKREDTMTGAKALVEQQADVVELRQHRLNAYAYRKTLQPRHDAFVRDAAVLSRELTRRTDRTPMENRSSRWGGSRG